MPKSLSLDFGFLNEDFKTFTKYQYDPWGGANFDPILNELGRHSLEDVSC
jgi:hypothetical protein